MSWLIALFVVAAVWVLRNPIVTVLAVVFGIVVGIVINIYAFFTWPFRLVAAIRKSRAFDKRMKDELDGS